jgi:hypothetical protein
MGDFLHAFLSVEAWMVHEYMLPGNVPLMTFHVYHLIGCLQLHAGTALLLPPHAPGIMMLEAKQIGILTFFPFFNYGPSRQYI